jgi:uncharacterized protein (DUF2336 family)
MPGAAADPLLRLAQSRSPTDRERLMQALARFCDMPEAGASPKAQTLIGDIFMELIAQAEHEIRARLSVALAPARWAPSGLVNTLALDDIEIARPVILRSPVLTDTDLIKLLVVATIDHQIEVARRPDITRTVVKAIVDRGEPAVLTALAGNPSAQVDLDSLSRLVTASRTVASLRSPLSRHPRLTAELAYALYAWVGEALRAELGQRFTIDPKVLQRVTSEAVSQAYSGEPTPLSPGGLGERQEMETRLIAKLQAAGQLRPSYLLKALRDGKLNLFELALASLAQVRSEEVQAACSAESPELFALACIAVGIDRSVFPTMLSLLRALNDGKPGATEAAIKEANMAFILNRPDQALASFRKGTAALIDERQPRLDHG